MIGNYIKIAIRNLLRQKMFTFINIFGLALSMAICLIVLLRTKDQLGYDRFHPDPQHTYRIISDLTNEEGKAITFATSPLPLAPALDRDFDIVQDYARIYSLGSREASSAHKNLPVNTAFTDDGFFSVFGFKLEQGSPATALQAPNSIVLSEATAARFFGNGPAMGKVVNMGDLGDFRVTGILEKPAGKSHIDFDAWLSMSSVNQLEKSGKLTGKSGDWNSGNNSYTYLSIHNNITRAQLNRALQKEAAQLMAKSTLKGKESLTYAAQPLNDIILGADIWYNLGNTGSPEKVATELAIVFIILLAACFNYTNLSIARSMKRGKEVGIRKVAGARRWQVFGQFITESLLTAVLSLGLAMILLRLIQLYLPFLSELIPQGVSLDASLVGWIAAFTLFTGLLAGTMPAWILSAFKPVEGLKNLSNIKLFGGRGFRSSLIVMQFTLSLIIAMFTLIFAKQFDFLSTANPGFNRHNLVRVSVPDSSAQQLANSFRNISGVMNIAAVSDLPGGRHSTGNVPVRFEGKDNDVFNLDYYSVDENFLQNLQLELLAGHTFPSGSSGTQEQYVILTAKALELTDWKTPSEAIGKTLRMNDSIQVKVAGIVNNFYHHGLETPYQPIVLRYRPQDFHYLSIRVAGTDHDAVIAGLEQNWKTFYPLQELTWINVDESFRERKGAFDMVSTLGTLAFIAISIACLGLLGMIMYNTEIRRREISIRKVLGAGFGNLLLLLSRNFIKLIVIAGLIAIPLGHLLSFFFLNQFANRVSIGLELTAGCFALILLIALLTIGSQVYRAVLANPSDSLRAE